MAPLLNICVFVLVAIFLTSVPVGASGNRPGLQRQKREWIQAPRKLKENHDYSGLDSIARIRSDKENFTKILYYLTGPGVNEDPVGVFVINHNTGFVKVTRVLDREEKEFYRLKGKATYADGSVAEPDIDLEITVEDVNDCTPVIQAQQVGSVSESSLPGTFVMQVIATDADQPNTNHSKIFYSIAQESNVGGMFAINHETGVVTVQRSTLDREQKDTYKLIIKASDMNGQPGGNTGGGEVEIKILDINDNIPTLEKESYEGSVEENTVNMEVMRVKAIDLDEIHTDNWLAVYEITSGNEAGYFTITTDSNTNEGIITVHKALNYEEIKVLNLEVSVSNKAAYNFGSMPMTGAASSKSYPVKINVKNQKEGPRFQPNVKVISLSEDQSSVSINKIITNYAAIDSDTLQKATNVKYAKILDEDNWLIIDEKTADIRLNKLPDRESKYLVNGTYYAKVICISNDTPSQTATGTIAIQVEDFNDHCPTLTTTAQSICLDDKVIYVTAVDEDEFPNSAPFEFTVVQESSNGKWTVEHLNATTAILRDQSNLWPGKYKVTLVVKDQQGKACADVQVIDVTVCTCNENTKICVERRTARSGFGASGILLMLLGLLLLLLLPLLLLFCLCGGAAAIGDFKAIPFDTRQQLISEHTEGQGEDKEVPLLHIPVEVDGGTTNTRNINTFGRQGYQGEMTEFGAAGGGAGLGIANTSTLTTENMHMYNRYRQDEMDFRGTGGQEHRYRSGAFNGVAIANEFLQDYYVTKSEHAAQQSLKQDGLQVYNFEGRGSDAGSVGCCSLLENDNDLSFLNDLGPKFKTLAEICQGSPLVTESVSVHVPEPPYRPVSPVRPSTSTHTHVHSHTETVRDRDRVSALDISNVASGSSTIIQEERITERRQGAIAIPKVQDKVVVPSQTLLIQQPTMYYAATPMYVVESNPQMVLVTGGSQQAVSQVGPVGLNQGLMQVGGIQGSQGVVLVDRQGGVVGGTAQVAQGISQGTVSRSRQVLVVENGSTGAKQGEQVAQGFAEAGQRSAAAGLQQGFDRGQGVQVKTQTFSLGSRGSAGSSEDFTLTATPRTQGRVVVQHKKVSVTERNVESSTRA